VESLGSSAALISTFQNFKRVKKRNNLRNSVEDGSLKTFTKVVEWIIYLNN